MKNMFLFVCALTSIQAFGSGSITRDAVMEVVCDRAANLCPVLRSLNIDPVGSAVRLRDGSRVMPYQFTGSSSAGSISVEITQDENEKLVLKIQ